MASSKCLRMHDEPLNYHAMSQFRMVLVLLSLLRQGSYSRPVDLLTCRCKNDEPCDRMTGYCKGGCKEDWYGPGCQVGNLALGRPAEQSSVSIEGGRRNSAELAVDGQVPLPADSSTALCSQTLPYRRERPWWLVSLSDNDQLFVITNITIYNALGSRAARLQRFILLYTNDTSGEPDPDTWSRCAYQAIQPEAISSYVCQGQALAKRIAVFMDAGTPENILTLCEVKVFGYEYADCPKGYTGPGCLVIDCASDVCRKTPGATCGNYRSCQYPSCPGNLHLPPDCVYTLPQLLPASWTVTATCDQIKVFSGRTMTEGNLEMTSLLLTMHSEGEMHIAREKHVRIENSVLDVSLNVLSNQKYDIWATPEVCFTSFICMDRQLPTCARCIPSRSVKIATAQTGYRAYDMQHNESCIIVRAKPSTFQCELPVSVKVNCGNATFSGKADIGKPMAFCQMQPQAHYDCTVYATLISGRMETFSATVNAAYNRSSHDAEEMAASTPVLAAGGTVGGSAVGFAVLIAALRNVIKQKLLALQKLITTNIQIQSRARLQALFRTSLGLLMSRLRRGQQPSQDDGMEEMDTTPRIRKELSSLFKEAPNVQFHSVPKDDNSDPAQLTSSAATATV